MKNEKTFNNIPNFFKIRYNWDTLSDNYEKLAN